MATNEQTAPSRSRLVQTLARVPSPIRMSVRFDSLHSHNVIRRWLRRLFLGLCLATSVAAVGLLVFSYWSVVTVDRSAPRALHIELSAGILDIEWRNRHRLRSDVEEQHRSRGLSVAALGSRE